MPWISVYLVAVISSLNEFEKDQYVILVFLYMVLLFCIFITFIHSFYFSYKVKQSILMILPNLPVFSRTYLIKSY